MSPSKLFLSIKIEKSISYPDLDNNLLDRVMASYIGFSVKPHAHSTLSHLMDVNYLTQL